MAIVDLITTHGAPPPESRSALAAELATLTYEAEGFAGSRVAPTLCWTFFDERPSRALSTGADDPAAALSHVTITALAGALDETAKHKLGASITSALLAREGTSRISEEEMTDIESMSHHAIGAVLSSQRGS